MFKLADGRQNVYQWDINVKLLLDESNESADEVHFSARFSRVSLSVEVVHTVDSSYVAIPNILLQKSNDIIAYSYITNADGSYTKYDTIIPVIARPKPSGYVYEETEILTWKTLDDKINDLGESTANSVKYTEQVLTDEQKAQARTNIGAVSVNEVPEQVQTDWDQKDDTAADYLKNRPFGEGFPEDLGTYNFTATSETTITYVTAQDDGSKYVLTHLFNHKDISNATQVVINGETDLWTSSYDGKGHVNASGDKFSFHCYYSVGQTATITSNANIFTTDNTYPVLFRDVSDDSIKKIGSQYIPNSVYTFENAPVKFGSGASSTVQGGDTTASGASSHAEGYGTTASGGHSHAEGSNTKASGKSSHAEGSYTTASGSCSHVEGFSTSASSDSQHVQGKLNVIDSSGVYAHIVGNGTPKDRRNIHALDWNGNAYYKGTVYVKGINPDASGGQEVATKSGWTANKYIGTDAEGNLVEKDAPTGGGSSVSVDNTLMISGAAADAKATGDQIRALSDEIANLQGGGGGLTSAQITALDGLFKIAAYAEDASTAYSAFKVAFGISDSGGGGETEKTIESISATYSGGDVAVGTALSDLTGIVVTATYSDGSTGTVTGYTLSGEIVEGVNIITVSYGGLTATFTVTGVNTSTTITYTVTNNLTNVTNSNTQTEVTDRFYSATLTVEDGFILESVVITMGGVDVTGSVYTAETGKILITEVTSDIVITAVASALSYVAMASSDIPTDTVKLYTDNATTSLATKYYMSGRYSLNATESDVAVKVRLTNNTDSGISSSNVYIGSTNEQAIRNPNSSINVSYAVSGNKGTVAAGGSVEINYTIRAGYWLYVCGYGSLTVEVIGTLDIREIGVTLATTTKQVESFTVYSDGGSSQLTKVANRNTYATTEQFESDTELIVTIVSPGAATGDILIGCITSGTLTATVSAYYGSQRVVKNFATGAVLTYKYTVKAGHYFALVPCNGATFYIERA